MGSARQPGFDEPFVAQLMRVAGQDGRGVDDQHLVLPLFLIVPRRPCAQLRSAGLAISRETDDEALEQP